MKKLIPLNKQSKRAQREHNQSQRGDWGAIKPTLRIVESKKRYSRARMKSADAKSPDAKGE